MNRGSDSSGETSASERHHHGIHIWNVFKNFQPYSSVSSNHSRVTEGMDENRPLQWAVSMGGDHLPDLVEGDLDDLGSKPFDGLQLRFRSVVRNDS